MVFSVLVAHGSVPCPLPPGLGVPALLPGREELVSRMTLVLGCTNSVSTPSVSPIAAPVEEARLAVGLVNDRVTVFLRAGVVGGAVLDMFAGGLVAESSMLLVGAFRLPVSSQQPLPVLLTECWRLGRRARPLHYLLPFIPKSTCPE